MTSNLLKDIQKQVKDDCALYDGDGMCKMGVPCPFFAENGDQARCNYYENMVLPGDEKLKARYWGRFGLKYWSQEDEGTHVKQCKSCGDNFEAGDKPKRQYCTDCRDEKRREQERNRKRRQRKNARK